VRRIDRLRLDALDPGAVRLSVFRVYARGSMHGNLRASFDV
jgi:hypothetical protein